MTKKQKPPHDLINAAQEISTVKRWLDKPEFKKAFEKEYKDFLASEESEGDGN
jgi:hypothetical protein